MLYQQEFKLQDLARPYLQQLAAECGETVHLAIFDELDYTKTVTIDKIEASNRLSISPSAGSQTPVHATAVGKVLVAYSTHEIQETVLTSSLERFTENTITDQSGFKAELKEINEQGYAIDDEELEPGLTCFAAPIIGGQKQEVVASFSISGPRVRMFDNQTKMIDSIKITAHQISSELK
nr:IclR family transcriptional regulator [Sporohalobacter salinus]